MIDTCLQVPIITRDAEATRARRGDEESRRGHESVFANRPISSWTSPLKLGYARILSVCRHCRCYSPSIDLVSSVWMVNLESTCKNSSCRRNSSRSLLSRSTARSYYSTVSTPVPASTPPCPEVDTKRRINQSLLRERFLSEQTI
jgi:hypothetical protein